MARPDDHKQSVTVHIFGQALTVCSDDESGVQRAAVAVDQQMHEIAQRMRTLSPLRIAVSAALYFAYEQQKSG